MRFLVKREGFTFIELLISILIFSIIIVSVYSTFRVGLTTYRKGERVASLYQNIRLLLNSLALDLRNSYKFSERESRFVSEDGKFSFYSLRRFYSSPSKETSQICRMEYSFDDGRFLRKVFAGKRAFSDDVKVSSDVLLENLSESTFEFPYAGDEEGEILWKDYWTQVDKIPLGLRINLRIDTLKAGAPLELTKIIYIPLGELGREE